MTDPLQALQQSKQAYDMGLIDLAEFNVVKEAFLRGQQIKAAGDTALITADTAKQQPPDPVASRPSSNGATKAPPQPAKQAPPPPPPPPQPQSTVSKPPPVAPQQPPPPPTSTLLPPSTVTANTNNTVSAGVPTNIPKMGGVKPKNSGTSMSGISVTDDAINLFYLIKAKCAYKWATWKIDDAGSQVVIAAVGDPSSSNYTEFLASLPEADCRYGLFDYQYLTSEGQRLNKLVFYNWAPDNAKVKAKMMYASTKDFFKGQLDGISLEFQASEVEEIEESEVAAAVSALKRQ